MTKFLFYCIFVMFPFGLVINIPFGERGKISLIDLAVLLFVLVSLIKGKKIEKKLFLKKQILLFMFISLLTITINLVFKNSNTATIDIFYFVRISLYSLFYIRVISLFKKVEALRINKTLLICGVIFSIFGLMQYLLYPDLRNLVYLGWDPHYYRLFSTLFDPNFAGIILVLTFFQFIFLDSDRQTKSFSVFNIGIMFILLVSIYLTRSRSAYLSLLTGLLALLFAKNYINRRLVALIGFIILSSSLNPKPPISVLDVFRVASSVYRINNWLFAFKTGFANFISGVGFSNARFSDSSFLYVFAATGIFGLISYLKIWINILKLGFNKDRQLFIVALILISSSFFNNTLFYPFVAVWFFAFLASSVIRQSS